VDEDDRVGAAARGIAGGVLLALCRGEARAAVRADEEELKPALSVGRWPGGVVSTLVTVDQACSGVKTMKATQPSTSSAATLT
jgi:hypothetical protein